MKNLLIAAIYFFLTIFTKINAQEIKYLSFPEILKIMESSPAHYVLSSSGELDTIDVSEYGGYMHPILQGNITYPKVMIEGEVIVVEDWVFDSTAWKLIIEGETYYDKNEYSAALDLYLKATQISGECYIGYLYAGDCCLFMDDLEGAHQYYKKAREINPYDYRTYMFMASVFNKQEKYDQSLEEYIKALTLKAKHKNILDMISKWSDRFEVKVYDNYLKPKAIAFIEGENINIHYDISDSGLWLSYGFAKGMFLGEPEIRENFGGSKDNSYWGFNEEKQCLVSLMEAYENRKNGENFEKIEYFENLYQIFEDGYLDVYVIYEIASRMDPFITLRLPEKVRENIESYIRKYVVVRK